MRRIQPTVSVIIPAYNHAGYLAQAIDSVLAQDYPAVELIVLDDGSSDSTRDVLTKYTGKFFWESHPNMGQAATLNKGWRLSKGDLLGYLSADDYLLPGAISTTVHTLQAHPEAIVAYCDFELVDPAGKLIRRVHAADFNLADMLTKFACPPGPGALFRRSAFEEVGGWTPELRLMSDYEYWLRLALKGKFVKIDRPIAAWRAHESSQSFSTVSAERAGEPLKIIREFFRSPLLVPEVANLKCRSLARAHLVSAQLHARAGRFRDAIQNFSAACKILPSILLQPDTWRLILNALVNRTAHKILWTARRIMGR